MSNQGNKRNPNDELIENIPGMLVKAVIMLIIAIFSSRLFVILKEILLKEFETIKNTMKQGLWKIWSSKNELKGKVMMFVLLLLLTATGIIIYLLCKKEIYFNPIIICLFLTIPLYLFILGVIDDKWRTKKEYIIKSSILILYVALYFIQIKMIRDINLVTLIFISTPLIIYFMLQFVVMGYVLNTNKFNKAFKVVGLKTSIDNKTTYPKLIFKKRLGEKKAGRYIYKFSTDAKLGDWEAKKKDLEQQFDTKIINLEYSKDTKKVVEMTVFNGTLPKEIEWDNSLKEKDGVISLGQGYSGKVKLDLNKHPHGVIVGITGVGKTTTGQIFIHHLKDNSDIYLIDFKGLLDFMFHDKVVKETITNLEAFEDLLEKLIEEANKRKALLRKMKAKNFIKYNQLVPGKHKMNRIVLFMDEIAEVTTLGKESAGILKKLFTFARITRALGFNLIFLTQRASRENLPGDIQDNLSWRMTGHLPTVVSSRIVLDSDLAASLPLQPGYMALRCSSKIEEFQTYYLDVEKHLEEYGYTQKIIEEERLNAINELEGIKNNNVISFSNKKEAKSSDKTKVDLKKTEEKKQEENKDNYGLNPLE